MESLAYQTRDVLDVMEKDSGTQITTLRVDGGASANNVLMQFQADILDTLVERPEIIETTAMGAAYLAGLAVGYWQMDQVSANWRMDARFSPEMSANKRTQLYKNWQKGVKRSMKWEEPEE